MQAVIDNLRANGVVVRMSPAPELHRPKLIRDFAALTFNDVHGGQAGTYSPDKGGEGAVDIYW